MKKEKHFRSTLLRLGTYLLKYKWFLVLAIILALIANILALIGPALSGNAIDAAVGFRASFACCTLSRACSTERAARSTDSRAVLLSRV